MGLGNNISLIVSTYNWPQALRLCLLSIKAQKELPKEVVIADDGSSEETKALIDTMRADFPVPLIHVWQPDEGFQLAKIRNRAIAAASGSYIVQIDGDLILNAHFIQDHARFKRKGIFVTGSRVLLNQALSTKLLQNNSVKVNLLGSGIGNRSNGVRNSLLSNLMAKYYQAGNVYRMRGCNMAFWKQDLLTVNGYNEDFKGWGREENELAVRLTNSGIKKQNLKFGAVVYHIYHPENTRATFNQNDDLLKRAVELKSTWCNNGLHQYLANT